MIVSSQLLPSDGGLAVIVTSFLNRVWTSVGSFGA